MQRYKKLALIILAAVLLFVILDWQYIAENVKYFWSKPEVNETDKVHSEPLIAADRVIVPSLGLDLPIVYVDTESEPVFQEALKSGVVHYPGTALPGESGNVYLFGHSSDFVWSKGNYKTAFAVLPNINVGAEIFISDFAGHKFTYRVTETKIVSPKDLSVLDQHDNKQKLLTLQTSYPVGTALKRFVVVSELVTN